VWGIQSAPPDGDNMALVETRVWGEDITNAGELVEARRFRDVLDVETDPTAADGFAERYFHDWRMRQMVVTQYDNDGTGGAGGEAPLRTAVTYLDHAGRPRIVAVYDGDEDPESLPVALPAPGVDVPTIAQIFADASNLRRLSETEYNARGEVFKQREYLVSDTTGDSYLETETYYDHGGRPTWIRTPGGGVQTFVYDAFGRQVSSSTWALWDSVTPSNSLEVQRTETTYDPDGNATEVATFDRIDGTSASLDETNAVVTYAHHWYDETGRVVCTADLGTDNTAYRSLSTAPTRATAPPVGWDAGATTPGWTTASGYSGARITAYRYDQKGNRTGVRHPDGTWTRHVYDGFGKVILTQENNDASDPGDTSITAYQYEHGRLVRIAAVLPGHGPVLSSAEGILEIDWEVTDGTLQITEFRYSADVVEVADASSASPVSVTQESRNNGWVGSIHFPGSDGQPKTNPDLEFAYYIDGKLATRTDARGMRFVHWYDALGNRVETRVEYPADHDGSGLRLEDKVERIELAYDAATGELTRATAYSTDEVGSSVEETTVAESEFAYDEFGSLVEERQARGEHVGEINPPAVVEYEWSFGSADPLGPGPDAGANRKRLVKMTYPQHLGSTFRRVVGLEYGTAQDVDDLLSRVTAINDVTPGSSAKSLAQYAYLGSGPARADDVWRRPLARERVRLADGVRADADGRSGVHEAGPVRPAGGLRLV
jgi:YD repeat-containing protein